MFSEFHRGRGQRANHNVVRHRFLLFQSGPLAKQISLSGCSRSDAFPQSRSDPLSGTQILTERYKRGLPDQGRKHSPAHSLEGLGVPEKAGNADQGVLRQGVQFVRVLFHVSISAQAALS